MSIRKYRSKRDLSRTGEPEGPEGKGASGRSSDNPRFVIQKHDASSLHYDFRLEIGDVLKSWAVPRGPSTDPGDKRLAIATESRSVASDRTMKQIADEEGHVPPETPDD